MIEMDITIPEMMDVLEELPDSVLWVIMQESQDTIVGYAPEPGSY